MTLSGERWHFERRHFEGWKFAPGVLAEVLGQEIAA